MLLAVWRYRLYGHVTCLASAGPAAGNGPHGGGRFEIRRPSGRGSHTLPPGAAARNSTLKSTFEIGSGEGQVTFGRSWHYLLQSEKSLNIQKKS